MAPENIPVIQPLFHCACPLQWEEPSERTSTGRRCWIVCYLDLGNGYHHSHSNLCNSPFIPQHSITSAQNSSVYSPSASLNSFAAATSTMVRHRMHSRHGGTRGGNSRSPASPASSAENPQYPNTRSGRGRVGLHSSRREEAAGRIVPFPLPLHQVPHTMQFWFRSALNSLVIVATVSISITEENEQHIPMTFSMEETNRAGPSRNRDNDKEQGDNGGRNRQHGKANAGSSHGDLGLQSDTLAVERCMEDTVGTQVEAGNREGGQQAAGRGGQQAAGRGEVDNPDDWACPIVEEPVTEEFIAHVKSARWHFF